MSSQPELYRTPKKPGYLGSYNWRATCFGLLMLVVVDLAATQFIAFKFQYQPALGRPLLRANVASRHSRKLMENADDLHGSARWATEHDIRATGLMYAQQGVYVGAWR